MKWISGQSSWSGRDYDLFQRAAEIFQAEGCSADRAAELLQTRGLKAVCDIFDVAKVFLLTWPPEIDPETRNLALKRLTQRTRSNPEPLTMTQAMKIVRTPKFIASAAGPAP